MIVLIKGFVVFELSRNAVTESPNEPQFPKRPSQFTTETKPKQVKHLKFAEYRTFVI